MPPSPSPLMVYPTSGARSESSTLPLKVADTGPILVLTTAAKPLSPDFSSDSQPGMQDLSTSGSLRSAQTFGRSAGKVTSPVIVMAIDVSFLRGLDPSADTPFTARYESHTCSTDSFSHRAAKIKMSRFSRPTSGEAGLTPTSLIRIGLSGKASRPLAIFIRILRLNDY